MKTKVCHRTGMGFDSHAFGPGGTLKLAGVPFRGVPALRGHSDGDALLHALVDALLGASALGDIGELFPDTDPRLKGAPSAGFLKGALARLRKARLAPVHVDVTVLADKPKIGPRKNQIRKALAGMLGLNLSAVSVKAKTQEGLRLFGPLGGIAVWAVATVAPLR